MISGIAEFQCKIYMNITVGVKQSEKELLTK